MITPSMCPRCGMADRIQKVSAILSEGISRTQTPGSAPIRLQGQTYWLPTQRQGSSITMLAQRLLPPSFNTAPTTVTSPGPISSLVLTLMSVTIGIPVTGFLVSSLLSGSEPYLPGLSTNEPWQVWLVLVFFGPLALVSGLSMLRDTLRNWHSMDAKMKQTKIELSRRRQSAFSADMLAKARYDQLYYCHRDDIVFIPGQTQSVSPEGMHGLLYG